MAIIKCHECGKDVSTEAKACPSCGAKVKVPKKPTSKVLKYTLGAAVAVSFIGAYVAGADERERRASMTPEQLAAEDAQRKASEAEQAKHDAEAKARRDDIGMAEATCSLVFEKRANDPSSVEWIREEREFSYTSNDMKHATSIQGVRAKNGFGGLVKGTVRCKLVKDESGWVVQKLEELH